MLATSSSLVRIAHKEREKWLKYNVLNHLFEFHQFRSQFNNQGPKKIPSNEFHQHRSTICFMVRHSVFFEKIPKLPPTEFHFNQANFCMSAHHIGSAIFNF